jgi:uncharacterized membrane-anchored protein
MTVLARPLPRLLAVAGIQLLILLSILAFKQYTVWTAETVLLKTEPIDPRDLVGSYAVVRYEISTIDTAEVAGDNDVYGEVFVELREGEDGYWDAVAIHDGRDREFDDTVLIKGDAGYTYFSGNIAPKYNIRYGIEEIFIPEASGSQIPSGTSSRPVGVEVRVDRFGSADPRSFIIDDESIDLEQR